VCNLSAASASASAVVNAACRLMLVLALQLLPLLTPAYLESYLELFTGHWLCIGACLAGSHLTVRPWHALVGNPVGLLEC
jgi:hypothetical protein